MLITLETTTRGEKRVYCTRTNSVVSFFADDGDGGSMLSVEHGEFAFPSPFADERLQAVKLAVLEEVALRLSCRPSQVEEVPFDELAAICDPDPETLKPRIRRRRDRSKASWPSIR
jgi:hypothetical protein